MRLLFVTPQVTPYCDPSSIGDTCAALPKALAGHGHDVLVLSPLYGFIDPNAHGLGRRLRKVEVEVEKDERLKFTVFDARSSAGVELMFLAQEELFTAKKDLSPDPEDGFRYGAFCKAAIEVLKADEKGFDVVHCHGWQAGLVPVLVDLLELETGTVLTVHDAAEMGLFPRALVSRLGLPARLDDVDALGLQGTGFEGQVSLLKGGVLEADRVTTVSPSYARDIVAGAASGGAVSPPITATLRDREDEVVGVVGGVDAAVWNAATDAHLEARFDPMDLGGKVRCKAALQRDLGLPVRDDVALVVALGPLHPRSGLDALARVVGRIMRSDVQLAIVGEGAPVDAPLATVLTEHAKRWPDRMAVVPEADHETVHRALGGADCVLVPPVQAPGGSAQLRALRYGALPIGPRVGSVADTVVDCDASLTTGTGFLYAADSDDELTAAVQRAIGAFSLRDGFERVRRRAMRADHGWERAAYLYERLYSAL